MLVLSRKPNEAIMIGNDIKVTVVQCTGGRVRLGIDAPSEVKVLRNELYDKNIEASKINDTV